MFAIEIAFSDGVSHPETILVRRPQALIGASDYSHLVVDDMRELNYQIRLVRDLGRRFRTQPVTSTTTDRSAVPPGIEGSYDGSVTLNLGRVRLVINSLDTDLQLKESEPPDRAGVRILRQACASPSPLYPAVVVRGGVPMIVSFSPEQPVYIGRSNQCVLRLDSADISARHARLGFEGQQFWVEDLGSTNGTFVHEQQISGRVNVPAGVPIVVGREATLLGVTSEEELITATRGSAEVKRQPVQEQRYPVIISSSPTVRPARIVVMPGMSLSLGRDPSCDMWVGAPHISRKHCSVSMAENGEIALTDSSTNGTGYEGGVLHHGESVVFSGELQVVDLGGGVTVAICFNAEQEASFSSLNVTADHTGMMHSLTSNSAPSLVLTSSERADLLGGKMIRRPQVVAKQVQSMFKNSGRSGRLIFVLLVSLLVVVVAIVVDLLLPVIFR